MKKAVLFGAGRVGRGFLAEIFQQAGYALWFVDRNINLVDQLNRRKEYVIHKAQGALKATVAIRDIHALHYSDEGAIVDLLCEESSIAAIAVSPFSLADTANTLAIAIAQRALEMPDSPFDIYLCDNSADPAARMRDSLEGLLGGSAKDYLETQVGLVRTIVMRLSAGHLPDGAHPLDVLNNGYPEMPVDATAFRGKPPVSPLIRLCEDFPAEATRKTYTLNMTQAAMAYLGQPLGLSSVSQAFAHPRVRPFLQQALEEAAHGLCGEFSFARRQMDEWNASILTTLENPVLDDSLLYYGIDSCRKVGQGERLAGAAALCQKYDRTPHALCRILAHAYLYQGDDPGTQRLLNAVQEDGIELALERFSRIDYRSPLLALVMDEYERALASREEGL